MHSSTLIAQTRDGALFCLACLPADEADPEIGAVFAGGASAFHGYVCDDCHAVLVGCAWTPGDDARALHWLTCPGCNAQGPEDPDVGWVLGEPCPQGCGGRSSPPLAEYHDGSEADDVRHGIARAVFLSAYADGVDSGDIDGDHPGAGGEWDDVAPATPRPAFDLADRILAALLEDCREHFKGTTAEPHATTWRVAAEWALRAWVLAVTGGDGAHPDVAQVDPGDAYRFGSALGLKALGHGVSPGDDVAPGSDYQCPDVGLFEFGPWDLD